jgi:hypothetical protein
MILAESPTTLPSSSENHLSQIPRAGEIECS